MMNHKELTIYQIRLADSEAEIESAIKTRISRFKGKNLNARLVKDYISTMTMLLLNLKKEPLGHTAKDNIGKALEICRKINRSIT